MGIGLIVLMGRRTTDEQYVDVSQKGITITSPTERLFLPASEINRVRNTWLLRRLLIKARRRKIKLGKAIEIRKTPTKVPLWTWLANPPPSRSDIRTGKISLKQAIEGIMTR
jgi:hypothetical protein